MKNSHTSCNRIVPHIIAQLVERCGELMDTMKSQNGSKTLGRKKAQARKLWQKILRPSCFGNSDTCLDCLNVYYRNYNKTQKPECAFLDQCIKVNIKNIRKRQRHLRIKIGIKKVKKSELRGI